MTQEGTENRIFVLSEAPVSAVGAGGIGAIEVGENNRTNGAESNDAPKLLSHCTSNLRSEDMAELCCQGIAINDDNNPKPDNFPIQG